MALLHSDSLEVRSGAGEIVALIYEAIWEERQHESDSEEEEEEEEFESSDEDSEDEPDTAFDLDLPEEEDLDVEELPELLLMLSKDSLRSRGRKERARGRSLFRDVLLTVEVWMMHDAVMSCLQSVNGPMTCIGRCGPFVDAENC